MKLVRKILLGLGLLLVLLVLISFLLPAKVHVERSLLIQAPPAAAFEQVNTLKNWGNWSPWHQIDPQHTAYTYNGLASGRGASYSWKSPNPNVGNGTLTLTRSIANETIEAALDFDGQGTAQTGYYFKPEGGGTRVTFALDSDMSTPPVIGRYFGLLMDKMIGDDYEKGLKNIEKITSGEATHAATPTKAD